MAEAVAAVELGSLLPALFLQQGRTLEAARAFFELATRASLPTKPAAGGTGGDGGGSEHGAGAPSARALELRLNFFQQARHLVIPPMSPSYHPSPSSSRPSSRPNTPTPTPSLTPSAQPSHRPTLTLALPLPLTRRSTRRASGSTGWAAPRWALGP